MSAAEKTPTAEKTPEEEINLDALVEADIEGDLVFVTNDRQNGPIYEICDPDVEGEPDVVGEQIGEFKDGKPVYYDDM